jgi:GTP-binding protein
VAEPLIVIIGAPNVGKSTLFNRLVGRRTSIVTDEPGVTRDRVYGFVADAPIPFRVVDTGGLTPDGSAPFAAEIMQQAETAMKEAAGILLVVDARAGATTVDREVCELLRKRGLPILLVANKIDSPKVAGLVHDLFDLGLGEPLPISSEHARGIEELLERVAAMLVDLPDEDDGAEPAEPPLSVAIVGRPNVGKSSLLNKLLGEERVMVSDIPGTTRDSVDSLLSLGQKRYRLIDTAGLRRRGKTRLTAERFSVVRARQNIERCDVGILVLDAEAGFAAQDAHIGGFLDDSFKPMVIAVNKWDLMSDRERAAKQWEDLVRRKLKFARLAPIILISAKTGQRVSKILDRVDELHAASGLKISTPELNNWLREVAGPKTGSVARGRSLRLFYVTQAGVHPPRFLIFCNDISLLHFSFKRYLINTLRERFGFDGAPIRIDYRSRREGREK